MPDSKKHVALVILNLTPGMDGGSSTMLELMYFVEGLGFRASLFNFFTDEPLHRALLAERVASGLSGSVVANNDVYYYRERNVDCQIRFLPFTVHEAGSRLNEAVKMITETISKQQIDYVLTADRVSVLAAHVLGIPGCHFFRSMGNIKRMLSMHPACLSSVRTRDCTAGSSFLKGKLKELLNIDSTVIRSVIDFESYVAPRDTQAEAVGFYAGGHQAYKGDEVVNLIIQKMPERKFIIVGGSYKHEFATFPENLNYCGIQRHMKNFYRQLKLVLVPSLVKEGFPRIILEAAANGIPAIANNRGGIPEALGDSGVLIDIDTSQGFDIPHIADCYVREIQRLFTDQDEYEALSGKALQRARQHATEQKNTLRQFFQDHIQ